MQIISTYHYLDETVFEERDEIAIGSKTEYVETVSYGIEKDPQTMRYFFVWQRNWERGTIHKVMFKLLLTCIQLVIKN